MSYTCSKHLRSFFHYFSLLNRIFNVYDIAKFGIATRQRILSCWPKSSLLNVNKFWCVRYKNLMLVAGGAGITPFLAILNDLLKRHQLKQQNLPVSVQVTWCVRSISELSTLCDIRPAQLCPSFTDSLTLKVEVFVTRDDAINDFTQLASKILEFEDTCSDRQDVSCLNTISCLTPTTSSQNVFMVAVILASVAGFILVSGIFNLSVSTPRNPRQSRFPMALDVVLFFISTGVGTVVCGGVVLLLWNPEWNCVAAAPENPTNLPAKDSRQDVNHHTDLESQPATLMDMCTITKGPRPQFQGSYLTFRWVKFVPFSFSFSMSTMLQSTRVQET